MPPQAISPNWHVIFIHYPLGLLSVGLIIEILSFLWRRSTVRAAGRWMLLIGALSCFPALTTGMYAFRDIAAQPNDDNPNQTWHQVVANSPLNSPDNKAWDFLRRHIVSNAIGTTILAVIVVGHIGCSNLWRKRLYPLHLLLLIVAFGFLTFGAWHGGESVYRFGAAIRHVQSIDRPTNWQAWAEFFGPPLQLHVMLAGAVVALAVVSLALSIRVITASPSRFDPSYYSQTNPDTQLAATPANPGNQDLETALHSHADTIPAYAPAARWWFIGLIVAICTAAAGAWTADWFNLKAVRNDILPISSNARMFTHAASGVSIIVLMLILAFVARFARRSTLTISILSFLLALAIALQIWVGILLLYDGAGGSLKNFSP